MITVADLLSPDHVELDLRATKPAAAIDEVAALVKNDPAVLDWGALAAGMHQTAPCLSEPDSEFALCIPHTRGDCVSAMVMSVGRSKGGIVFPKVKAPVRYVFCLAAPQALTADYLRIVGLLARVFKDRATEDALLAAATPVEFIDLLARREAKL